MSSAHADRIRRAVAARKQGQAKVRSTTTAVTLASVAVTGALALPGSAHKTAASSSGTSGSSANSSSGSTATSSSSSSSSGFSSGSSPTSSSGSSQATSGGS
jgi:hypothetical protein